MVVARNQGLVDDIFCPRRRVEARPERRLQRRAASPAPAGMAERLVLAATASVLLLVILTSLYGVVSRAVRAAAFYDAHSAPVLSVTVKPGDTLWSFARAYGAPGDNVLDTVEAIADVNHLDASASLIPGETLTIPVRNPRVAARLLSRSHPRLALNK